MQLLLLIPAPLHILQTLKLQSLRQKQNVFVSMKEGIDYTDEIDRCTYDIVKVCQGINEIIDNIKEEREDDEDVIE